MPATSPAPSYFSKGESDFLKLQAGVILDNYSNEQPDALEQQLAAIDKKLSATGKIPATRIQDYLNFLRDWWAINAPPPINPPTTSVPTQAATAPTQAATAPTQAATAQAPSTSPIAKAKPSILDIPEQEVENLPPPQPTHHEKVGQRIADLLSRSKGISPAKIKYLGYTESSRLVTYRVQQEDDGEVILIDPEKLQNCTATLVNRACIPQNSVVSIRSCYGYVAVEVTKGQWAPLSLYDETLARKKNWRVTPVSPLVLPLGREHQEGQEVSINLSKHTGVHTCLSGSTGAGKNVALNVLIAGSFPLYLPWFVQFIMVTAQPTDFRFYDRLHPWLWNAQEVLDKPIDVARVLSKAEDIATMLRYVPEVVDEKKDPETQGLIFQEADRRDSLFAKANAVNFEEYNDVAYQAYQEWKQRKFQLKKEREYYEEYNEADPELPILRHLVIGIDEVDAVGDKWGKQKIHTFNYWVRKVATELRKFGIHLICATQRPAADSGGPYDPDTRAQFGNWISLRHNDEASARMGLPGFNLARYLDGDGDAYVLLPGMSIPVRFQFYNCDRPFINLLVESTQKSQPTKRPLKLKSRTQTISGVSTAEKLVEKKAPLLELSEPEPDEQAIAWSKILAYRKTSNGARETATALARAAYGPTAFAGNNLNPSKRKLVLLLRAYEPAHPALQDPALQGIEI